MNFRAAHVVLLKAFSAGKRLTRNKCLQYK